MPNMITIRDLFFNLHTTLASTSGIYGLLSVLPEVDFMYYPIVCYVKFQNKVYQIHRYLNFSYLIGLIVGLLYVKNLSYGIRRKII